MPLSAGTYSNWLPPSSLWVWSFYYFCWAVFFLLVFALDRPVPTPRRSWCHKQGLSVGSFLGPSRAVCFTGNGVQRRNSIRMELTSWWRTNMWAGPWGQPGFSLLFWSSWIKARTRWPWRSFPTKMTLWFSLLGVIRPHRFASRFSCGAFQVKTGELHVFDLICLTQARHFWGHCATAAPCPQLQGLTAWSWDTAPLRLLKQSPTDSRSCIGICFSSFLVWSKATGDFLFFPPERAAVFGLRKDEVKKWQEKAVSLCFWFLDCFFAPAPDFHWWELGLCWAPRSVLSQRKHLPLSSRILCFPSHSVITWQSKTPSSRCTFAQPSTLVFPAAATMGKWQ